MADLFNTIIKNIYGWPFAKVIICAILTLIVYTLINIYAPKKLRSAFNGLVFMCIFVSIVLYTIINRSARDNRAVRLIPFQSLLFSKSYLIRASWLNAFFFFPFGLSLPYIIPEKLKRKALITIISATCISLCIELVQYVFRLGHFETDDIIMNTLGASIGTLSYITASKLQFRLTKHKLPEDTRETANQKES